MSIFYAVARLLTATPYILVNVLRVPLVSNTPNGFLLYNVAVINYSTYVLSKQPKGAPPTAKWQWVSAHNMRKEFIYEKSSPDLFIQRIISSAAVSLVFLTVPDGPKTHIVSLI